MRMMTAGVLVLLSSSVWAQQVAAPAPANPPMPQTPNHVAILNEMNHDVRIIPLDGRSPLQSVVRQWAGVSRGRWEGDTLVVKTTNFTDKTASFSPSVVSAMGTGATLT